jgi:hypothetical protein
MTKAIWPELDYTKWKDSLNTLMLYAQIVGKIRLRSMPWLNHSWHVALYVSAKGLTTGSMPYNDGLFEIEFDFNRHILTIVTSTGTTKEIQLNNGMSVADFYAALFSTLHKAGINVSIYPVPNELETAIPFREDDIHKTYNKEQVHTYWLVLVLVHNVFTRFRAGFRGKCSPVHLFWGAFDLAVTRFSGKPAPLHPGIAPNIPVRVMQEAYSHEVSSCGFWPGSEAFPHAAFYSYCYPTPANFSAQPVEPKEAFYSQDMGEFLLLYDAVRKTPHPEATLLNFMQTTYAAAANTGNWKTTLECDLTSFEKK